MRYWKSGIFFLIAFLIQTSLLNMINIGGCTPNLLLCLVVIFSFLYEKEPYGLVWGAVFGLLYDICFGVVIGPTPIALVLTAAAVVFMRAYSNIENIVSMWTISAISFVLYYIVNWGLLSLAGIPLGLGYALSKSVWPMVYSIVVITLLYMILIKKVVKHHNDRYFI